MLTSNEGEMVYQTKHKNTLQTIQIKQSKHGKKNKLLMGQKSKKMPLFNYYARQFYELLNQIYEVNEAIFGFSGH